MVAVSWIALIPARLRNSWQARSMDDERSMPSSTAGEERHTDGAKAPAGSVPPTPCALVPPFGTWLALALFL